MSRCRDRALPHLERLEEPVLWRASGRPAQIVQSGLDDRAPALRFGVVEHPQLLAQLHRIESGQGGPLLNPLAPARAASVAISSSVAKSRSNVSSRF
jgi:hypothetical protein